MTVSSRRKSRTRKSVRQRRRKFRNIFLVIVLFLGLALVMVLAVPTQGVAGQIRSFLLHRFGFLSILMPLFLFQTGIWLLDLRMKKSGFRLLSGIAVTGYFFTAVSDLVISRLSPVFHDVPGGTIAGSLGDMLVPLIGAPISFLLLFAVFLGSLVAFTGWDIGADFQSLADRLAGLFGNRGGKQAKPRGKTKVILEDTSHAWAREQDEVEVPDLPFKRRKEPSPDAVPPGKVRTTGKQGRMKTAATGSKPERPPLGVMDPSDMESFVLPPISCLDLPDESTRDRKAQEHVIQEQAELLIEKLEDFGIESHVERTYPGPVITRFEVAPGPGIKVSRFVSLSDDLALALKARRIRILAPIPGKGAVGIEVPNPTPETVFLREIMQAVNDQKIPIALGKKIQGEPFVSDITTMPHLLIAGATGSGKSVCMHSIIATILLTRTPSEVRLAMVDPKMLELSIYEGIPHLWAPVVLEMDKATLLLEALVVEMENRYKRLSRIGVRSIEEFNSRLTPQSEDERIPFIVVFIDELADLMVTASREVEPAIARLAHMARAVGIHLVLATQRPSVDVITGVIKANFPSRIAFNVQSKTDSRTILDMNGAEKLLGNGDMLFLPASSPEPMRIHGSFITTEETRTIVEHLRDQPEIPFEYDFPEDNTGNLTDPCAININDPFFEKAKQVVVMTQQGSVSILQRRLRVGYSRAASLIDMLEQAGVVGPFQGSKARDVLISLEDLEGADEEE